MSVTLTHQQQAAVDNRGGELLVSAAAGSGKTRILVERLLDRVQQEHIDLDHFLVITYTKAAAAELRGKILDELNVRLAEHPEDAFLRRQRSVIYRAQISTIHSFCTALLREEGYRIDLEPDFRVADDGECVPLRDQVLERVLERHYENLEAEPEFAALADTMGSGRDDRRLVEIVRSIFTHIQSHSQPEEWLREKAEDFALPDVKTVGETKWGQILLRDAEVQTRYWQRRFVEGLDLLQGDPVLEAAYSEGFDTVLDRMDDFLSALERGWDSARQLVPEFPRLKPARKVEDEGLKAQAQAIWKQSKERFNKLRERFEEDSDTLLADMRAVAPVIRCLHELVGEFSRSFSAEKRRRNLVDFSDLEHLALELLVSGGAPTEVARQWENRYAEIMVDEYQDTNQVQNEIFQAISAGGTHLFQVGDVKQSIYRFRLADPGIFVRKYQAFAPGEKALPGEPRKLVLSYNFRSRASVLEGVNFVFENIMSEAAGELDYTADQRLYPKLPYPEQPRDKVELNVVDMAELEQDGDEAKIRKDEVEVDFVARRVRELLDEGFPVTEGEGFRPVRPEDIAILYRSPSGVLRRLTAALDGQRVPWSSDGAGEFFEAEEVSTVLSYLEIVDNPRQDVPLLAVLSSPMYRFIGSDLALLRAACPQGDFYDCLCRGAEGGEASCAAFLKELNRLRALAVDLPGHRLLREIYDGAGALAVFGTMDGGGVRQSNLNLLYEYACQYESNGHKGVFGLVNQFRRMRESGQGLAAAGRERLGGVRIMSIHKSKGLEFPVVVLAGLSHRFNTVDTRAPVLFHSELGVGPKGFDLERRIEYPTLARRAVALTLERELKAEEMRLLYVAMTRAREKLILVYADQDWQAKAAALAPDAGPRPDPAVINAKNCMGDWVMLAALARPEAHVLRDGAGVTCPAIITQDLWDIRFHPARRPKAARGGQESPAAEIRPLFEEELERLAWTYPNAALADVPSKATATQLKGRELDAEASENTRMQSRAVTFARPRFDVERRGLTPTQKGTAVHTVMQLIRLDRTATPEQVAEEIARLKEMECLTPAMAAAVNPAWVSAFFNSDLGREAKAAADLRREFKFSVLESAARLDPTLPEEEQVLLQGVIDCCFTGAEGLTVVDFKTDRVRPGAERAHSERYRTQLEVYTGALSRITGTPVARRVLWYFATGAAVEL